MSINYILQVRLLQSIKGRRNHFCLYMCAVLYILSTLSVVAQTIQVMKNSNEHEKQGLFTSKQGILVKNLYPLDLC